MEDQFKSALEPAPAEAIRRGGRWAAGTRCVAGLGASALRETLVHARGVVGLVLVVAAIVWAITRGLTFYGFSPAHLIYDLDQPPWLLLLVSAWLWYRNPR